MHADDPKQCEPLYQDPSDWQVPIFMEHPITKAHGARTTIPLTLYSDSTPHSTWDSFYTCYLQISWQKKESSRILLWCITKSACCKCGCKARCTLDELFRITIWSLNQCGEGQWPTARHDGLPWWRSVDAIRAGKSGSLGFHGAMIQYRGDWQEFRACTQCVFFQACFMFAYAVDAQVVVINYTLMSFVI